MTSEWASGEQWPRCQARPILIRVSIAVLAFLLVALVPLHAQDPPATTDIPAPIVTDRPTVTNSSVVVPSGSLQAENGFLETDRQGQSIADGPETLVRFGVATRTELRFTAPNYYYDLNAGGPRLGIRRLGHRSKRTAWPHARWIRCFRDTVPKFPDRRRYCIQRRVRSGAAGGLGRASSLPKGLRPECSRCTGPLRTTREI